MEPQFVIQTLIRFYDYVRITGGLNVPGRTVKSLRVSQSGAVLGTGAVNLSNPGLPDEWGFAVSFTTSEFDYKEVLLSFELDDGNLFEINGAAAADSYLARETAANHAQQEFFGRLQKPGYDRVLEVGSRARSGIVRRHLFQGKQYTGLDVLPGPNVDVVGDAHVLSAKFASESFDAVYSIWTFEHLAMPWKVALELNKVLREGGVAYFQTHQTVGMHDLPCDFWRFSDTCWHALFNEFTGFRVENTFLGDAVVPLPHVYHDQWIGYEKTAGFYTSAVMVEKIGRSSLTWDLDVARAVRGVYPA